MIFLITSREECLCPCCGGGLKYRDHRLRVHKVAGGGKEWYRIRRMKCTDDKCGRLHNELPDCMFPYKHYDAGLIEDIVEWVFSAYDPGTDGYPCEGAMKHWKWWMQMNEGNMEGQIRSAAHRFLDFSPSFLESVGSLLEELKGRITPGWLKAAARFIIGFISINYFIDFSKEIMKFLTQKIPVNSGNAELDKDMDNLKQLINGWDKIQ